MYAIPDQPPAAVTQLRSAKTGLTFHRRDDGSWLLPSRHADGTPFGQSHVGVKGTSFDWLYLLDDREGGRP